MTEETPKEKAKEYLLTLNYEEKDFQFQHLKNTMKSIDIALQEQEKQLDDKHNKYTVLMLKRQAKQILKKIKKGEVKQNV